MSRAGQTNGGQFAPVRREDDKCPICSSTRYMNKNLLLLTNSVCYHKLCETCVDRLFAQGPRVCPYAGCGRTIRRTQFRPPTFEDLKIEREIDIRRRVASIFNRRQEEFMDLRSWNDYLENVETLTFNLLYDIDVEETEAKLASYAAQNRDSISRNRMLEGQDRDTCLTAETQRKQHAKLSREESVREAEEHRQQRIRDDVEAQERIRRGDNPKIAVKNVARKKAASSREAAPAATADLGAGPLFEIQGLKPTAAPEPKEVFDPFGGFVFKPLYFHLQPKYHYPWLDAARSDTATLAGGFDTKDYCARAMTEAFAGLGVFIGDDLEQDGAEMSAST